MRLRVFALLMLALLGVSFKASAAPVTWNIQGYFWYLAGTEAAGFPLQPVIGDPATYVPYSLTLHFNDAAALTNPGCGAEGTVCRYSDPSMTWSGFTAGPLSGLDFSFDEGRINVYNKFDALGDGSLRDGYHFVGRKLDDHQNLQKFTVFFLSDGDIVSGPGLPDTPPALDANMVARSRYCRGNGNSESCEQVLISGPITGASIPEPGTLALLGIAMAGAGLVRRRRPG